MPKINIIENDLTTAGGLDMSNNAVYVPGFVAYINININKKPNTGFPHLFKSVKEFTSTFSKKDTGEFKYVRINETKSDDASYKIINIEKGTQYALTLLSLGLPVLFDPLNIDDGTATIDETTGGVSGIISGTTIKYYEGADEVKLKAKVASLLPARIKNLKNKNIYNVKFITTGGYNNISSTTTDGTTTYTTTLADTMLTIAESRSDCTALIDHEETTSPYGIDNTGSFTQPTFSADVKGKFGALFTPWCNFQLPSFEKLGEETIASDTGNNVGKKYATSLGSINMPGSFAYLMAYANSIANNNASWLAVAGATRGNIPYLVKPLVELTEAHIDAYSLYDVKNIGVAFNPIANINPYGVIIWGNRTLHNSSTGLVASSFLNIRQLTNDIKKNLYAACKGITFEQNSDILWIKFKSLITPLLDKMQTGEGIAGYELKKRKTSEKATLTAVLRIYPIEAVENFEMTVELADEATNITD